VVGQEVGFRHSELEVQDIKVLSLDPSYVPLAEDTSAECPVYVFKCRIIEVLMKIISIDQDSHKAENMYLRSNHESTQEYTLQCPFLKSYVEVWPCSVDVYKRSKQSGEGDLSACQDVCNKRGELGKFWAALEPSTPSGGS
jgi:hypothetical protein